MFKKLLVVFLLFAAFGCQQNLNQGVKADVSLINPKKNQLLFVSLEVQKADEGLRFTLLDKRLVAGKLKRPMPTEVPFPDHFILEFQNENGGTITQVATANPLTQNVEVANEDGSLNRQKLDLDKASIVLRIKYSSNIRNLRVSDPSGTVLSTLPLDL